MHILRFFTHFLIVILRVGDQSMRFNILINILINGSIHSIHINRRDYISQSTSIHKKAVNALIVEGR